jgi:hypothetical protein
VAGVAVGTVPWRDASVRVASVARPDGREREDQMKIEFVSTVNQQETKEEELGQLRKQVPAMQRVGEVIKELSHGRDGEYDSRTAALLAAASAWAYADIKTFMSVLCRKGAPGHCVAISITNEAVLVDNAAYLFQSEDGEVAVLVFRGTQPTNAANWLLDMSPKLTPLLSMGQVHGGFLRGAAALWPVVRRFLIAASRGLSIQDEYDAMMNEMRACGSIKDRVMEPNTAGNEPAGDDSPLRALYICGHSMGGALAVLAAAAIHMDIRERAMDSVVEKLRGIYTFGQPMVCDKTLAKALDQKFGRKLFRHVYGNDLIPRLPPRTAGEFTHFGREYIADAGAFAYRSQTLSQVSSAGLSTLIGVLAWLKEQIPLLRLIRLPFSMADHSLVLYLRAAETAHPGLELLLL